MIFCQQSPQHREGEYFVRVLVKRAHDAPHVDSLESGLEGNGACHAGFERVNFSAARAEFQRQAKIGAAHLLDRHARPGGGVYRIHHVGQGGAIRRIGLKLSVKRAIDQRRETARRLVQIHGLLCHVVFVWEK